METKRMLETIEKNLGTFSKETPKQMAGFKAFMEAVESATALDAVQKELIAIGLAITAHCDWCIAFHVKKALDAGASREQILEAGWMAVLMGGGPALMYFQEVLKALDEL